MQICSDYSPRSPHRFLFSNLFTHIFNHAAARRNISLRESTQTVNVRFFEYERFRFDRFKFLEFQIHTPAQNFLSALEFARVCA